MPFEKWIFRIDQGVCNTGNMCFSRNDNDNAVETLYHASQTELNDGDDDGRTPLMLACESGNYKSVKTLLSLGADIVIR